jgi:phosphoribosyl 1,2-cyclic phosphodiesterase
MTILKAISLQSGSNGNSIYVETPSAKLLFDAGISGIQAEKRLSEHGIDIMDIDALFISHDHSDHIKSAGIFHRKFGHELYMTSKTMVAANKKRNLGRISSVNYFKSGDTIKINDAIIKTTPTPHDGVDGVVFVVECCDLSLGILTDLGFPFKGLKEIVCELDGVFLESNYDPTMLKEGPYPHFLKQRISQNGGHISNEECANLLVPAFKKKLKWACLSHLSETNNDPLVALKTNQKIVGKEKPIFVASRYKTSQIFTI